MLTNRILIPVALGLAAAAGNYITLQNKTATHRVVALHADVKPGVPLTEADFRAVEVRGDSGLFKATVPFADRQSLYGLTLRQKVAGGGLLFKADVETEAYQIHKEHVHPGFQSVMLPTRPAAVIARPVPGQPVMLDIRQPGAAAGSRVTQLGPYLFLGWMAAPPVGGKDLDIVYIGVSVRIDDVRGSGLLEIKDAHSPDRVIGVELWRSLPAKK